MLLVDVLGYGGVGNGFGLMFWPRQCFLRVQPRPLFEKILLFCSVESPRSALLGGVAEMRVPYTVSACLPWN